MKKIISLTYVFIKEYYQNLSIFDFSKKKFNKKSIYFWLIALIFFGVSYVSYDIIKSLVEIGQEKIFLSIYLPILVIIISFQTILSCANVFFFSKDIINVLCMPIKPFELLIAKFATLMSMIYGTEAIFALVPLSIYGMMTSASLLYYFWEILILFVFPIIFVLIISLFTFFIMRFAKFLRNKNRFKILIVIILMVFIIILEFIMVSNLFDLEQEPEKLNEIISFNDKIRKLNNIFLIINPIIDILNEPVSFSALICFFKVALCNIIGILLFITFGSLTYIGDIVKNIASIENNKKRRVSKIKYNFNFTSIYRLYIEKEFKLLFRESSFFMHCVFPVVMLLISSVIVVVKFLPVIFYAMQDENYKQLIYSLSFNTEIACDILIVLQMLFAISNISLTAISREGRSALFIKYIPVDFYKQFIYKNIPQFLLNLLISVVVLGLVLYIIPTINIGYLLLVFAISIFINLLNCYLMLIVDLRRPNIYWSSEQAVIKKNDNKVFQYALFIINVLLLLYIATIFKNINIVTALIAELLIYGIMFFIIDRCVNKWKDKLFDKIY